MLFRSLQWKEFWSAPKYRCDNYRHCGAYGKCGPESDDNVNKFECTCLPGYEPKSPKNWYHRDGSGGCVRKQLGLSMCGNGEGFVKMERLKGPDSFNAVWMDMSMSSSECEQACLRNCSCTAFISMNIDGKGTRCLAWYGELVDVSEISYERRDLNIRVDATELGGLLHLLAFFLNFHFFLFLLTDRGLMFFFFFFVLKLLTQGSPMVFLATRGSWLLQ